ncbi:serine protease inhibitor 88Ea-like [Drosophila innubila]|uniref:serine protease inhibitor 88Ea-like n=1 Tax=Drosophila innubila TaxID=198719 RepID=UPI00148BE2BB|nr:serine protease inhibitor 88Ea-like [Drosophila innubila]
MKLCLSLLLLLPALLSAELCDLQPTSEMAAALPHFYQGQLEFSVAMLEAIRNTTANENVFFSPYSIYHALLLAYFGATGETEEELSRVLRLGWAPSKEAVRYAYRLDKSDRLSRAKDMPLELSSADRMYFDEQVKLTSCLETRFHDEIVQLNIKDNVEQTRQQINGWVANVTKNQIENMMAPEDIDSNTKTVLANAAYFKGQWINPFKARKTFQMPFHTARGTVSLVPMMSQIKTFPLHWDMHLRAEVVQLPYRTSFEEGDNASDISMVIILPFGDNALEQVLTKLNSVTLEAALREAKATEIVMKLPKFKLEQRLNLRPILRKMGVNKMFGHDASFNDFSADQGIHFGDVQHLAKIKVDEEGSVAAAKTRMSSLFSMGDVVICDRPFVFLIYDRKSKAILFTGIYRDPTTME